MRRPVRQRYLPPLSRTASGWRPPLPPWAVLLLLGVVALVQLALPIESHAHEFHPGVLAIHETGQGQYRVRWTPPRTLDSSAPPPEPVFPEHCTRTSSATLDCGPKGLLGPLSFGPLAATTEGSVGLSVHWSGGSVTTRLLPLKSRTTLYGAPSDAGISELSSIFGDYFILGTEHMLTGWDHLLFVLGLVLLAPFDRKLILAVTAFTVAHSITLALAVLGRVRLAQPPVELLIALSIVLLISEAARTHSTLARRSPWLVAFAMGLLHGLGFAGVLEEVGVVAHHAGLSLFAFNLGVENGQLAFLTGVGAMAWLLGQRKGLLERTRAVVLYAAGTAACFWSWQRLWTMLA